MDLKYSWQDAQGWHTVTIESSGNVGAFTSLAFNEGFPAISYWDSTNGVLKYAWHNGSTWQTTVVDIVGGPERHTSLAFNNGEPAIAYWDAPNQALKYAWHNIDGWHTTTIESGLSDLGWASLAVHNGHPAISYGFLTELKYAWLEGGTWRTMPVYDGANYWNSLAFNGDYPAIAFDESIIPWAEGSLKFAQMVAGPLGDLKGRIAFVLGAEQKLYVMNADGSSRQQVPLPPLEVVSSPQWSRDGQWLTFCGGKGNNGQIYIVRPDGTGFRRVTNGSGDMVEPSFSPDGSQIAFCGPDGIALYIINTDGTDMRQLPVDGSFPRWWPLGDKILYSNWGRTYESDLFLYDCAAGQSIQITHHTPGQAFIRAAWSPNGRRLAVDFRDRNRTGDKSDVLIMNADGSNPYNFTAAWPDSDEGTACWSPDGQFILFASDRSGNFDIWYSPVDIFAPVNLTNSPLDEFSPAATAVSAPPPTIYYVDAVNGNDNNNGLSRRTAFATIAKGINSATNHYKVLVYPGVYQEEVDFKGKAITVQGVATKEGIPIIENPGDFAVSFYNDEGPRSILKNFVIRNSFMAIFIAGSSPTLKNLNIIGNKYGVEAYAGSEPDISNCIFWNNSDSDLFGCEARYSCTSEPGQGNIAADPCFVDPNNSDYHLLSQRGRYWPEHDVWVLDKVTSP
ncbi:MAG: hypothetical protein NTX52_01710, partial [Planctomycetota bacterium]|nr:hypothetical protein [Planctomycetota bacterium]